MAHDLVAGRGMTDFVVWNYLDGPFRLPRPSHLYWMPLTTWVAAAASWALGGLLPPWRAVQLVFALLSALVPTLATWLALAWWGRRDFALAGGMLTIFTGYYFIYWGVSDTFTPFALAVALALLAAWRGLEGGHTGWWVVAGVGVGLSHLTRADGPLVGLAVLFVLWSRRARLSLAPALAAMGLGYIAVMAPWWWRNVRVAGTPFPGGGTKTMWLRGYDELFSFGLELGPSRYVAWGLWPIVRSKLSGVVWNSVILAGGLQFFLVPPVLVGGQKLWEETRVRLTVTYTAILLGVMALVFTFPSRRGSTLHSAAALLPWLSALAPGGIAAGVKWVARRRPAWNPEEATKVFLWGFVGLAVLISLWQYALGVWFASGPSAVLPPWNRRFEHYQAVDRWLDAAGVPADQPVLVVDPPSFYGTTGRWAVVIPADGPVALERVADLFGARFLVLESDHASPYEEAYRSGQLDGWQTCLRLEDALGKPVWLLRRVPAGQPEQSPCAVNAVN
ncbi:MAG: hypothetical protein Q9O62_07115 [Ardenticatenia bacterium]|nr:hypothetical protein [Ardenticatenia bacterium]